MVSSRDWTTPPPFTPLPYRLRDAASGPDQFVGHQKLGYMYQPDDCNLPNEYRTACEAEAGPEKEPTGGANWRGGDPFVLYTWLDCTLVGQDYEQLRQRTENAHANNVQTMVEEIFWTGGTQANVAYPHLAANAEVTDVVGGSTVTLQTSATTITGTFDIVEAIGLLEGAMAECYGGTPFIHMPRTALAHMAANHLVVQKNNRLLTPGGSVIVAAPGYPGTSPAGAEPATGRTWIYATGSVKWMQSDVKFTARDVRQALGRSTNTPVLVAEQWFGLAWDCCHFAIDVSLGGVVTGAVNSAGG